MVGIVVVEFEAKVNENIFQLIKLQLSSSPHDIAARL